MQDLCGPLPSDFPPEGPHLSETRGRIDRAWTWDWGGGAGLRTELLYAADEAVDGQ